MADGATGGQAVVVVGAGRMGVGIAEAFLLGRGQVEITLGDQTPELAQAARTRLIERMCAHAHSGLIDAATAARAGSVQAAPDIDRAVAKATLVIEAVTEDLAVKHRVLAACDAAAPPDAVIASNTSSLRIDAMAAALRHPERFLGTHWFNPPEWTPCVEVVVGSATDPAAVDRVVAALSGAGKHPSVVADSVGFIANRLQMALFCEAARCVAEGLTTAAELDQIVRTSFGFRLPFFGPFQIADMAGLQTYGVVARQHHDAFGERFAVPPALRELVADGNDGTSSGAGFYRYEEGAAEQLLRERDRCYAGMHRLLSELAPASGASER